MEVADKYSEKRIELFRRIYVSKFGLMLSFDRRPIEFLVFKEGEMPFDRLT